MSPEDDEPVPVSTTDRDADATARAKALFIEGVQAYDQGDYDTALARFRSAHELVPLPALRYNIARTLESLDEYGDALAEYEALLLEDGTEPAVRDTVQQRIEVLRARAGADATASPR